MLRKPLTCLINKGISTNVFNVLVKDFIITLGKSLPTDKYDEVKENELLFAKTKPNAIIPSKRDEDGCYDIYACFDDDEIVIEPFRNMLVDSGIATAFDKKWRLAIRERGTNSKSGLMTMSGQVDSGYRGSIFVSLYNANRVPVIISKKVEEIEICFIW